MLLIFRRPINREPNRAAPRQLVGEDLRVRVGLSLDIQTGGMSDLGMAEMHGSPEGRGGLSLKARLEEKLQQSNTGWSVSQLLGFTLVAGAIGGAAGFLIHDGPTITRRRAGRCAR